MEGTIAVVTPWAGNFAPRGWMFCQGQSLPISGNEALYSVIGTTYGGNGQTNFNLPDLQSRVVIGAGTGPGLQSYEPGEQGGTESNTITVAQMAPHMHQFVVTAQMPVNGDSGTTASPLNAYPAPGSGNIYSNNGNAGQFYGPLNVSAQIGQAGGSVPVENIQPVLCVNYIICTEGVFPSRN